MGRPPPAGQGQPAHQPLTAVLAASARVAVRSHPRCCRACRNIFKVPDLRNKILFTLLHDRDLPVRGATCPVPGIDLTRAQAAQATGRSRAASLGFLQLFSGGALTQFAIFALGIMPYITASIIMQILGVVIPKLEEWQKQGAVGQRKITQWTRYLTIGIAVVQSTGLAFLFHNGGGGFRRRQHHRPRPVARLRRRPRGC